MLQLKNSTPFQGSIYAMPDPAGIESLFTVVKGTFTLDEQPEVAEEQLPVTLADEYHADPESSSIRTPSDVSLAKPATDVLLFGQAHALGRQPAAWVDVSLTVGILHKTVRVVGDRRWEFDGVGHSISSPIPFQTMPLIWERAYGGTDSSAGELRAESRNPVGLGYRAADGASELHGLRLPNLEDPEQPIRSWRDNPPPACFAPVAPHWEPRARLAGTYDEEWQRKRAPYLPADFDPLFLQTAPPGLVADGYLQGGEPIELNGAHESGLLQFQLPRLDLRISYLSRVRRELRPAHLDTVIIEPDADRLILVWRAVLALDKKSPLVELVDVQLSGARAPVNV